MSGQGGALPSSMGLGYVYFDYVNPAVMRLLGTGQSVLDVGCGTGALARAAQDAGNRVTGVELWEPAAVKARERVGRVVVHDVTDTAGLTAALGEQFDVLVFADVLEHLPDPLRVLSGMRALVKPGGRVLVSLPNVAAWTVRLGLLAGSFEYAESGIMDRTHLRFFTRASGRRMVEAAGFSVGRIGVTPHMARAIWPLLKSCFRSGHGEEDAGAVLASPAYQTYARWVEPVETFIARLWPGMLATQFVFEGRRPGT
ncbi:MAG: class I SAM-dependent methyltransferase [Candidatus Wallbacteria bacterium]|nr:class I SAM-dependent methyltransferase [Candidatus Wallbacteria bacterium]